MQNIFDFVHKNHNYAVSVKDWERKSEEGKGQNGIVFKVTGRATGDDGTTITDDFAVKVAKSTDANAKLTNEVESLKAIGLNKNILPILASKIVDGKMCFLCQYIPRTLAKVIRDLRNKEVGGSAPLPHADVIAASAFRAVAFSSRRGFANRDCKDANIVIPGEEDKERCKENGGAGSSSTSGMTARGLSAASAATIRIIDWDRATRTTDEQEEGYVVGTPSYIPVEQLLAAKKITSAADVFSLSVVLAKMVLPRPIFKVEKGPDETFVQRCLSAIVVVMGQLEESDVAALGAGTSISDADKPDVSLTEETSLTTRVKEAKLSAADHSFYLSFFQDTLQHRPDKRPSPWSCFRRLFVRLSPEEKAEFDKLDTAEKEEAEEDLGSVEEVKKLFGNLFE